MDNNNFNEKGGVAKGKRHRRTQSNSEYIPHNLPPDLPLSHSSQPSLTKATEEAIQRSASALNEREIIIETLELSSSFDNSIFFSDDFLFGKPKRISEADFSSEKGIKVKYLPSLKEIEESEEYFPLLPSSNLQNLPLPNSKNHNLHLKAFTKLLERKPSANKFPSVLPLSSHNALQSHNTQNTQNPKKKKWNFQSMDPKIKELAKKLEFSKSMFSSRKKTSSLAQDDLAKISENFNLGKIQKGHFRQISDGKLMIKYSEREGNKGNEGNGGNEGGKGNDSMKIEGLERDVRFLKSKVMELDERNSNLSSSSSLLKSQNEFLEKQNSELKSKVCSMENSLKKNSIALNAIKSFLMNDSLGGMKMGKQQVPFCSVKQKFENVYVDMKPVLFSSQSGSDFHQMRRRSSFENESTQKNRNK